jgi:polysaccharide biosynthesis/export protein
MVRGSLRAEEMSMTRFVLLIVMLAAITRVGSAQVGSAAPLPPAATARADGNRTSPPPGDSSSGPAASSDYMLGPGDLISVFVGELEDEFTDKSFRIDMSGDVTLPYAGRIHAAGLTADGLGQQVVARLKKIIKDPDAVVGVVEFHSQPVSVLGEVNTAGQYQVQGQKKLLEAISMAGGFTADVGNTVTVTRSLQWGRVPLPNAHDDPTGQFSIASVSVKNILHSKSPEQNIQLMPGDVISVARAEIVYAVGSVTKPGGFPMSQDETLSALQVIALAEGLTSTAALQSAKIIRLVPETKTRTMLAVNLKQLLEGSAADVPLQPGDILFVPNSKAKTVTYRSLQAIANAVTGMAIYGRY